MSAWDNLGPRDDRVTVAPLDNAFIINAADGRLFKATKSSPRVYWVSVTCNFARPHWRKISPIGETARGIQRLLIARGHIT